MSKIHLIGNAHLDPVWLWRWQEGFSEIIATFRSALDRMKEFPDFKFTSACAAYYMWIEKIDPEMFEEIRERVREGRWCIVGGMFLQPDCNIPCGESFSRHILISQRYFAQKFGLMAKTGYNVDSFGHNANLPKILKNGGMDSYVFMRPFDTEKELEPSLFSWESDDGSRVTTFRVPKLYNISTYVADKIGYVKSLQDKEGVDFMALYGVGNHGGGPTIKLLDELSRLDIDGLVFSTPDEYFLGIDKNRLPVVKDELQHHARGCYSACSEVKNGNRRCESNLIAAEKFCVMAEKLTGLPYPADELRTAWQNLLFNQFHDILGGCSIKGAYEDASYLYGEAMSITERVINTSLQKIALGIDTLCGETLPAYKEPLSFTLWEHEKLGTPVIIFNPHDHEVTETVRVYTKAMCVCDCEGNEVPFAIVRADHIRWGEDIYHTAFNAVVPAFGYAVYRVFRTRPGEKVFEPSLKATETSLENSKLRVEFDSETGEICRIFDKASGKNIVDGCCKAVLIDEVDCDTWAHDKDSLGEVCGSFGTPHFTLLEANCVRAVLRVTVYYGNSVLTRDYTLLGDSDTLTVRVKADFRERHMSLKLTFPTKADSVLSQIPYGTVRRGLGTGEEPCGSWIASGDLCIANTSKHGYDTTEGEVRLTALRGAIYADHNAKEFRDEHCEYMDMGISEFSYSLFPFTTNAAAERAAQELNFGLRLIMGSFHDGALPERAGFLEIDSEGAVITAIKKQEDGDGTVVRLCEMNGESSDARIHLFDSNITVSVGHNELVTLVCRDNEVERSNIVENT